MVNRIAPNLEHYCCCCLQIGHVVWWSHCCFARKHIMLGKCMIQISTKVESSTHHKFAIVCPLKSSSASATCSSSSSASADPDASSSLATSLATAPPAASATCEQQQQQQQRSPEHSGLRAARSPRHKTGSSANSSQQNSPVHCGDMQTAHNADTEPLGMAFSVS